MNEQLAPEVRDLECVLQIQGRGAANNYSDKLRGVPRS
jgi:hypothetical protein